MLTEFATDLREETVEALAEFDEELKKTRERISNGRMDRDLVDVVGAAG